jgi:hypothetical protein
MCVLASYAGSLCVGIIFIAYALQAKYRPFLDPNVDAAKDAAAVSSGADVVYVRVCAPVCGKHAGGAMAALLGGWGGGVVALPPPQTPSAPTATVG